MSNLFLEILRAIIVGVIIIYLFHRNQETEKVASTRDRSGAALFSEKERKK